MYLRAIKSKCLVMRFGGDLPLCGSSVSPEAIDVENILSSGAARRPNIVGRGRHGNQWCHASRPSPPCFFPTEYVSDDDLYRDPQGEIHYRHWAVR